ncbi:hypothetical protein [Duncaniella muris]|uniref:hypothetical protein n=1 Tax=Duncaniella muris TaxID=2094150 RepID=UPI0025B12AC4|nr:hypothetical protein [Duncaniella muris]
MPKSPESRTSTQGVKATVSSTKRTNLDKLSKSQLIELLSGNIKNPITPEELYRAAVSIVAKWCNDVVSGSYASMYNVQTQLDALQNIYRKN